MSERAACLRVELGHDHTAVCVFLWCFFGVSLLLLSGNVLLCFFVVRYMLFLQMLASLSYSLGRIPTEGEGVCLIVCV